MREILFDFKDKSIGKMFVNREVRLDDIISLNKERAKQLLQEKESQADG